MALELRRDTKGPSRWLQRVYLLAGGTASARESAAKAMVVIRKGTSVASFGRWTALTFVYQPKYRSLVNR